MLAAAGLLGGGAVLWRPLPVPVPSLVRVGALVLGVLLYVPGIGLVIWGRLALGAMYNVSSSFGAQLYAGHRLITGGPFAHLRHPIYAGVAAAAVGGVLIYRTWTAAFLLLLIPSVLIRARREERVLSAEFGPEWAAYCERVPAWLPRFSTRLKKAGTTFHGDAGPTDPPDH